MTFFCDCIARIIYQNNIRLSNAYIVVLGVVKAIQTFTGWI